MPMEKNAVDRRSFLAAATTAAGALASAALGGERDWTGRAPVRYPDPDVVVLDKRFQKYNEGNKGELQIKEAVYRIDPRPGKLELVADCPRSAPTSASAGPSAIGSS